MTVPPPPGATPPPPPGAVPPPPPPPVPPMPPTPPMGSSMGSSTPSNSLAIVALCVGIASIVVTCGPGLLLGPVAIVLGVMAKGKAKQMNGNGDGLATGGIITGIIGLVLGLLFVILIITGAILGDSEKDKVVKSINKTTESINKQVKDSQKEYQEAQDRNGDKAKKSDYDIVDPKVEVSSYGSVTYKAFLENQADFESSYTATVECEGDQGDTDSSDVTVYSVGEGNKESFSAYLNLDSATTSADCSVTKVIYGY